MTPLQVSSSDQLYLDLCCLLHYCVLLLLFLILNDQAQFIDVLEGSFLGWVGLASAIQHNAFELEESTSQANECQGDNFLGLAHEVDFVLADLQQFYTCWDLALVDSYSDLIETVINTVYVDELYLNKMKKYANLYDVLFHDFLVDCLALEENMLETLLQKQLLLQLALSL